MHLLISFPPAPTPRPPPPPPGLQRSGMDPEKALANFERGRQKQHTLKARNVALGAAAPRADIRWSFDEIVVQFPASAVADGCPRPVQAYRGIEVRMHA